MKNISKLAIVAACAALAACSGGEDTANNTDANMTDMNAGMTDLNADLNAGMTDLNADLNAGLNADLNATGNTDLNAGGNTDTGNTTNTL